MPSPAAPPSGCRFHTRCWLRERLGNPERCSTEVPEFRDIGEGHQVACHFAERVEDSLRAVAYGDDAQPVPAAPVPQPETVAAAAAAPALEPAPTTVAEAIAAAAGATTAWRRWPIRPFPPSSRGPTTAPGAPPRRRARAARSPVQAEPATSAAGRSAGGYGPPMVSPNSSFQAVNGASDPLRIGCDRSHWAT